VDLLSIAGRARDVVIALNQEAEAGAETGVVINLFWILVSALTLIFFLTIVWTFAFKPLAKTLDERRARIEQGLADAEQARTDRANAETDRLAAIQEARREANEILARAQKVSQEARDADIAATKSELERLRERATADIEAEKQRAITELRGEVTDLALAAAGRVVGETLSTDRERRLVQEFLAETTETGSAGGATS
jgi:F-type H+-transporting ATPase subunit b